MSHPDSLLVAPHFVHLKKVIVEWMVSSAASTFQISLSVWPHIRQTTLTVGNCLNDAVFLSITAISADLPLDKIIFCFVCSCFRGFWYLHFGHLSDGLSLFDYLEHCPALWTEVHFGYQITRVF